MNGRRHPAARLVATVTAALLLLSAGAASAVPEGGATTDGKRGPAAPQVIDPAGDANGLSTVLPYSNVQTPAVSQADADVTSVLWQVVKDKKHKVTGFTVQVRLSAAPRADTKVVYRMLGTPACGSSFGVIYNSNLHANPYFGPRSAVRDTCTPRGEVRDTAIPLPKIAGATITWTVPLTAIPRRVNIVAGTTITDLRFGTYAAPNLANFGYETYLPLMDDGRTKRAFSLS